jgi:hypothetical protein
MPDQEDTHREQADDDVAAHMALPGSLNVNETVVEEDDQADNDASDDVAAHGFGPDSSANADKTVGEGDHRAD